MLNTPAGMPVRSAARRIAAATRSAVAMCPLCALNTTGQPAARAAAVSPPAVENAREVARAEHRHRAEADPALAQVDAWQRLAFGPGAVDARAMEVAAPQDSANRRSWPLVRLRSPWMRVAGSAVSRQTMATKSASSASSSAAMVSRNSARRLAGSCR